MRKIQISEQVKNLIFAIAVFFAFTAMANSGQALNPPSPAPPQKIPKITKLVVHKAQRTLSLYSGKSLYKTYMVALGKVPIGHKEEEGDMKTPEGNYMIIDKNDKSEFYLSLRISYPNQQDSDRARRRGVSPGGDIMIHGLRPNMAWLGPAHRAVDWTKGCIAVTNEEITEIFSAVRVGTPIQINP